MVSHGHDVEALMCTAITFLKSKLHISTFKDINYVLKPMPCDLTAVLSFGAGHAVLKLIFSSLLLSCNNMWRFRMRSQAEARTDKKNMQCD